MGLENFKSRKIEWNTVNQEFKESIQIVSGDVNARTVTFVITDNGDQLDLTGYSVKLAYRHINKYNYSDNTGFVMLLPTNAKIGEFSLTIPTEMTNAGSIKTNLILLNENLEQVIVSKNITFISDDSTLTDLAHEVNNNLDDFTKLLLENMPQVLRIELNDLQDDVKRQGVAISTKAEQLDLSITNKNVASVQTTANQAKTTANQAQTTANQAQTTANQVQTTANQAESVAQNAMTKATESQANSLPLTGNAVSASKLATPRKLGVNLQSPTYQNFDSTADVTNIGVSGVLPIANGGTATSDGVINTIAYANSADGDDGFTTVYPNLNLLDGTKDFSGTWSNSSSWITDGTYKGLTVKKKTARFQGIYKTFTAPKDGVYTFSVYIKASGTTTSINRHSIINGISISNTLIGSNFDWRIETLTVSLKTGQTALCKYEIGNNIDADSILWVAGHKWEEGSIATPYMQSDSEVTTADYPKYIGFSNIIKPNKTYSDYKWLPMGLVSIDSATGLLKPSVMGVDYAQAQPVGSVISNSSNSTSGYTYGTWQNIGSSVIGSTTIYYWKRTS